MSTSQRWGMEETNSKEEGNTYKPRITAFTNMFNDIGKKIMIVAKVLFWIGVIGSGINGITMIVMSLNKNYKTVGSQMLTSGIKIIVFGIVGSWIGTICLYGFGKLIDDSSQNRLLLERIAATRGMQWSCRNCGHVNPGENNFCQKCGNKR